MLPKLPVPDLAKTIHRYMEVVKVLVLPSEVEKTTAIVDDFMRPSGMGERLQKYLLEKQNTTENWAYEWWLDDMYLKNSAPLPIYSNPGMILAYGVGTHNKMQMTIQIIRGLFAFKEAIDKKLLSADFVIDNGEKQLLCMEQYARLFTSYRMAGLVNDVLISTAPKRIAEEYIIVAHKNQFFKLPVKIEGHFVSENQLTEMLLAIKGSCEKCSAYPNVGLFTSQDRRIWGRIREQMLEDSTNRKSLKEIENCCFILCLDESKKNEKDKHMSEEMINSQFWQALQVLHGGGGRLYGGNRWYDKTIQVIITDDGSVGVCYEHSPSEGMAVVRIFEEILRGQLPATVNFGTEVRLAKLEKLEWNLNEDLNEALQKAEISLNMLCDDLDFYIFQYDSYGRNFPKQNGCSPDAYVQIILQLAYYSFHSAFVATYESASTRRFRLGRVDCIRATTPEMKQFVTSVINTETTNESKILKFRKAIEKQTLIMKENINGEGMDIHLLGLREAAKIIYGDIPEFFTDKSFLTANKFKLSSSQVTTTTDSFMYYGPVIPEGYGVSYNLKENKIIFCVTCMKSAHFTSSKMFSDYLRRSLDSVKRILSEANE